VRCTRCDRIVVPQAVGLTPAGLVVFGWCLTCLAEQGCTLVESPGDGPFAPRGSRKRRARWRRWRGPRARSRRLALVLIAAVMAIWSALLMVVGAVLLASPAPPRPFPAPALLAGGGMMAATSLALWLASLDLGRRTLALLKVVQVAAAVVSFGVLALGIARHDPQHNPLVVGVAAAAFATAWTAHWGERKVRRRASPRSILPEL
jgi:4-amino-4-deoxy-L-arabinose transferase-like glycosyltransferase